MNIEMEIGKILNNMNIEIKYDNTFDAESFQIIQLIVEVEETFNIQFPLEALDFEKLNSIDFFSNVVYNLIYK